MRKDRRKFWPLPSCSKLDLLDEGRHSHIILAALNDKKTHVEGLDKESFSIYGPEEALLAIPISATMRIILVVYSATISLFSHHYSQ